MRLLAPDCLRPGLKVCIASSFGRAQGPDHTEAIVADTLIKHGFEVCFATNCRLDMVRHFSRNFGICLPPSTRSYGLLPSQMAMYPSFSHVWVWASIQRALKAEQPDFLFCDGLPYRLTRLVKRPTTAVYFSEPPPSSVVGKTDAAFNTPANIRIYSAIWGKIWDAISSLDYDILIANSRAGAAFYEGVFGRKVHVLFSPVDTERFIPGQKENLVTAVGIVIPRKNLEAIIDAVAMARTKPRLAIIGNVIPNMRGYLETLKRRVRRLGADERVTFHMNAADSELRSIVSRSKICLSAGVEYLSLAVIEQMSAGCVPIVSRRFVPWFEILERGKYGFGFDSVEEIADSIDTILGDKNLYNRMSKSARLRARDFDVEQFGKQLVEILLYSC